MPQLRRSLTRRTLLITSLPKLSKTRTFQIGSPSEFSIGVDLGINPLEVELSVRSEVSWGTWLRFRTRSIDAEVCQWSRCLTECEWTHLSGDLEGIGGWTCCAWAASQPCLVSAHGSRRSVKVFFNEMMESRAVSKACASACASESCQVIASEQLALGASHGIAAAQVQAAFVSWSRRTALPAPLLLLVL